MGNLLVRVGFGEDMSESVCTALQLEEIGRRRDDIQNVIRHADSKAQALVGVHSAVLAGAVALVKTSPPGLLLEAAAVVAGLALVVVLVTLLPRLNGRGASWVRWYLLECDELAARLVEPPTLEEAVVELQTLARIARRKMVLLRAAVILLITSVVLLGLSLL